MADIELPPKSALELQIDQEKAELAAVPKIPIAQFMGGPAMRCHLCGRVVKMSELQDFDTHVPHPLGETPRKACPYCYSNAR